MDAPARTHAVRAAGWLVAARLALAVGSYAALRRAAAHLPARRRRRMTASDAARAIGRAARMLPATTCLARSLAAECLLRREGLPADLTIGVALDGRGGLRAHAWVASDGTPVAGGDESRGFSPLTISRP
jgi:hypothetical protein